MRLSVEVFIAALIIAVGVLFSATIITNTTAISNAKQYQSMVTHKLNSSDFASEAVQTCKEEAEEDGYKLDIQTDGNQYDITLVYKVNIPIVNFETNAKVKRSVSIAE